MRPAIVSILFVLFSYASAEDCPATRDVWISSASNSEVDTTSGKFHRLKLKIYQEFALLDFDVSNLKGKTISAATLFVAPDGGERFAPKERHSDLRWFTVSTISAEWEEGLATNPYTLDDKGHGATFNEASYKTRPWTIPGSKCWDVTLGNGNTLRCDVDAGDPKSGWFEIPLDKRLVEACIAGAAHGFLLMDGSTFVDRNCFIQSREGKKPPFLRVTLSGEKTSAPAAPANLSVKPAPNEAAANHGALEVSLTVPDNTCTYQINFNGTPLPRWQIPFAGAAGTTQTFFIHYLPPGVDAALDVRALDAAGNISAPVSFHSKTSSKITVPALPALDHASQAINLHTARGEIATVPVTIKKPGKNIQIQLTGLDDIPHKLWRIWFVKSAARWVPEFAIPVTEKLPINFPDDLNKTGLPEGQVNVDLIIPPNARIGQRNATISVIAGGEKEDIVLNLTIHSAVIPPEIHFNPELNAYSPPGPAGSEQFFDSHRIAHYNRCSINSVPYDQRGGMSNECAPKAGPDGHITDWSIYDKNFGPLLDGSAFKDNPRPGIPVPVLYLPMNEHWPLDFKTHYHPGCPLAGKDWKPIHDLLAKPPEQSFSTAYKSAFTNCSADFLSHFEEKHYTRTFAQCFFNNKYHFGKEKMGGTAWTMDEPSTWLDWQALNFYSRLFHSGIKEQKSARLLFRADVSRPMWQGNCSDGLINMMYANNEQFDMPQLMQEQKRRMPAILYAYGSANPIGRSNLETVAWCLKAYCHGCDGVVPWQSLAGDKAFDEGDPKNSGNALIVDGRKRFGVNAIASLRVHAFRDGAQLCELLRLLEIKRGWSRAHSGALVSQLIPMGANFKQSFADDAAALKFDNLDPAAFVRLKEGLLKLLDE